MIEEGICGIDCEIMYDNNGNKNAVLDIELVKLSYNKKEKSVPKGEAMYALDFFKNDKRILRLHLQEALQVKAVIDQLVFDANQDMCLSIEENKECDCYHENRDTIRPKKSSKQVTRRKA